MAAMIQIKSGFSVTNAADQCQNAASKPALVARDDPARIEVDRCKNRSFGGDGD